MYARRDVAALSRSWNLIQNPEVSRGKAERIGGGIRKDYRHVCSDDVIPPEGMLAKCFILLPLKRFPLRVAKYDVRLRDASLRAVHAMHAILSRMVLFHCNECRERFPTFHPAFVPPPSVANQMELLRHGADGLAPCNVEVASWDQLPALEVTDGAAECCYGTCLGCRRAGPNSQSHLRPTLQHTFDEAPDEVPRCRCSRAELQNGAQASAAEAQEVMQLALAASVLQRSFCWPRWSQREASRP